MYGMVDGEVEHSDGVATCDRRGIGMRHDSVSMGDNGETKTVINFTCTNHIFNIYTKNRIDKDALHLCRIIAHISYPPCSEDSVLRRDIGIGDGQTISNQAVVR